MPMEFGTCLYWVERRATMQRLSESWRELSALGAGAGTTHLASDRCVEETANALIQVWRLLSLQSLPPARQVQAGCRRSMRMVHAAAVRLKADARQMRNVTRHEPSNPQQK